MDAFLATFWLIGQILSIVALSAGLVLSVLYWGLRETQSAPVSSGPIELAVVRNGGADEVIVVARGPAPEMAKDIYDQLAQLSEEKAEEARPPFMRFPSTQGPRPAAPA